MPPPTNMALKRRMEGTFVFLMVLFFALVLRLTWIQGIQHAHFEKLAESIHRRPLRLFSARGLILDRTGQELVSNVEAKTVIANPRAVADKPGTAQKVAELLGGSPDEYLARLSHDSLKNGKPLYFTYLARAVDRNKVDRLMALHLPGLEAQPEPKRIHPSGSLAAHVTGYVDVDGTGRDGMEREFNTRLEGKDGVELTDVDAINRPIPDTEHYYRPPVNGGNVKVTLDANIQAFAEAELRKLQDKFAPEGATAIVEDVRSGQILALANSPAFDPNNPASGPPQYRRDRAIQDLYEPGSVFKTLTLSAALEEHLQNTTVFCSGSKAIGKRTIRCAHGEVHGRVGLREIEEHSCNVGAATIGLRLGRMTLYHYIKKFGFLEKTGIELPGEEHGLVGQKPEEWPDIKTANVAFGQGVVVTPIAVARMYSAIANDGVMLPSTILMSVNGKPHHPTALPRRIVSPQTAQTIRGFLEAVVEQGTGKNAKIPNYRVGGKTGTAQLVRNGRYAAGAYVSSFIGILPLGHPRIAILVAATDPTKNGSYGATVAAPAVREIARQTMAYLRVPPDAPGDYRDGANLTTFANWERHHGSHATDQASLPSSSPISPQRHRGSRRKASREVRTPRPFESLR